MAKPGMAVRALRGAKRILKDIYEVGCYIVRVVMGKVVEVRYYA